MTRLVRAAVYKIDGTSLRASTECYFFFFSSRRRHTRSKRDWSSDVCSSDLSTRTPRPQRSASAGVSHSSRRAQSISAAPASAKIGRASCREKSVDLGGSRIIKKKKRNQNKEREKSKRRKTLTRMMTTRSSR